jgi:hypothetical protein
VRALERIALDFSWAIGLQLNINGCIAAFGEGNGFWVYVKISVPEKKM